VFYNLAALYTSIDKSHEADKVWMKLAKISQKEGDTLLFRLAINHIDPEKHTLVRNKLQQAPAIDGRRLGDTMAISPGVNYNRSDLWVDGEHFLVVLDKSSRYITNDEGVLISAWQSDSDAKSAQINNKLSMGDPADRPFKTLGIPDRRLSMTSGEYLAYDNYGLAVRISNDKVRGWFLYEAH